MCLWNSCSIYFCIKPFVFLDNKDRLPSHLTIMNKKQIFKNHTKSQKSIRTIFLYETSTNFDTLKVRDVACQSEASGESNFVTSSAIDFVSTLLNHSIFSATTISFSNTLHFHRTIFRVDAHLQHFFWENCAWSYLKVTKCSASAWRDTWTKHVISTQLLLCWMLGLAQTTAANELVTNCFLPGREH